MEGNASADEMMPILIYTVTKACVGQYYSNLQYISRYRDQHALASDRAYHFTSLLAVATFIERMDQSSLVIDEKEYQQRMEESIMHLNEAALKEQDDELTAQQLTSDECLAFELSRHSTIHPEVSTTEDQFRQDALRLFLQVKEKIKVGASKSIELLGDLMERAEAKIKDTIGSRPSSPEVGKLDSPTLRERILAEEDDYQLQLAMALSLSEQEHSGNKMHISESGNLAEQSRLVNVDDDPSTL